MHDKKEFDKIVETGECPFCHVIGEMHFTGDSKTGLWCANCGRVVCYVEGVSIYEETDEAFIPRAYSSSSKPKRSGDAFW